MLHKATYRFNNIFIKIPTFFFEEIEKLDSQLHIWNCKGPQIVKTISKKGEQSWGTHTSLSSKLTEKAAIFKIV